MQEMLPSPQVFFPLAHREGPPELEVLLLPAPLSISALRMHDLLLSSLVDVLEEKGVVDTPNGSKG